MIGLLGVEKVRTTADAFFDELVALCALLRAQGPQVDHATLAEAAHKAKGAASLLGQSGLDAVLRDMESQARDMALTAPDDWAQQLQAKSDASQSQLRALLRQATGSP